MEAVTLRADTEALLAIQALELIDEAMPAIESFTVSVLLIAGELEDGDDRAAAVARSRPNSESLRLPELGHGGACAASGQVLPTARAFLDRWFG